MILIVILIALFIVIIILKAKDKFRCFIGDDDAFQLLAIYTSCLQNKMQFKSSFYVLLCIIMYLGEFWKEIVQEILSLCQTQHFPCVFVLVGNRRAPCPAPCLELPHTAGNTGDLQPLCATPSLSLPQNITEALHISHVSWDILMCVG